MFRFEFSVPSQHQTRHLSFNSALIRFKVFGTSDNLQSFVGLRAKYILTIVKEVLNEKKLVDITPEKKAFLTSLTAMPFKGRDFDGLIVFDAVQFAKSWAKEWTSLLEKVNSLNELAVTIDAMNNVVTEAADGHGGAADTEGATKLNRKSVEVLNQAANEEKSSAGKNGSQCDGGRAIGTYSGTFGHTIIKLQRYQVDHGNRLATRHN